MVLIDFTEHTVGAEDCAALFLCVFVNACVRVCISGSRGSGVRNGSIWERLPFFILEPGGWERVRRVCPSIPGHCICVYLYLSFRLIPFSTRPNSLHHLTLPGAPHINPAHCGEQGCCKSLRLSPRVTREDGWGLVVCQSMKLRYLSTQSRNGNIFAFPHQLGILKKCVLHTHTHWWSPAAVQMFSGCCVLHKG